MTFMKKLKIRKSLRRFFNQFQKVLSCTTAAETNSSFDSSKDHIYESVSKIDTKNVRTLRLKCIGSKRKK